MIFATRRAVLRQRRRCKFHWKFNVAPLDQSLCRRLAISSKFNSLRYLHLRLLPPPFHRIALKPNISKRHYTIILSNKQTLLWNKSGYKISITNFPFLNYNPIRTLPITLKIYFTTLSTMFYQENEEFRSL